MNETLFNITLLFYGSFLEENVSLQEYCMHLLLQPFLSAMHLLSSYSRLDIFCFTDASTCKRGKPDGRSEMDTQYKKGIVVKTK